MGPTLLIWHSVPRNLYKVALEPDAEGWLLQVRRSRGSWNCERHLFASGSRANVSEYVGTASRGSAYESIKATGYMQAQYANVFGGLGGCVWHVELNPSPSPSRNQRSGGAPGCCWFPTVCHPMLPCHATLLCHTTPRCTAPRSPRR